MKPINTAAVDVFSSSSSSSSRSNSSSSSRQFQQQQQQQQWMVSGAAAELLHDQELTSSRCLRLVTVLDMSLQRLAGSQTSLPHNMRAVSTCVQHLPHQMVRGTCAIRSQMCWQWHCHEACSHAFVDDAATTTLYMLQVKHAAALACHAVSSSTHSVFRPDENGVVELGDCTWGTHCRS